MNFSPDVGIFKKNCDVVGTCGVNACRLVVGKSEGKCRNEWCYNMEMNLKEIGYSTEVMKRFMWLKVGISTIQFREFVDWQCSMLLPWDSLLRGGNHFTKPPVHQTNLSMIGGQTVDRMWHHLLMHFCC